MPKIGEPSYTDLVHEVVRESPEPLSVDSIVELVNQRREIATRNPKATVRNAISQSHLLGRVGSGLYGYVPRVISGSLLRLRFDEKRPANRPLDFADELIRALWPDFFEGEKRKLGRQVTLRLPDGSTAALTLTFVGIGKWGSPMPDALRAHLIEHRASAGDSLLIRIVDGERGECEGWFESRLKRDEAAIARRNREVADAALKITSRKPGSRAFVWEISATLLVEGLYRGEPAPDPIESILGADKRFMTNGLELWAVRGRQSPDDLRYFEGLGRLGREIFSPAEPELADLDTGDDLLRSRRAMERMLSDLEAIVEGQELGSPEEIDTLVQSLLAGGGPPRREATTPLEQAQELMYEAWEARSERERVRLAREALKISPDCADAYVLLAEETARSASEAADLYAKGVAAGERALGPDLFREGAGHFWGIVETRPYMRARHGLAQALWEMGKQRESIEHLQAMLDLNPVDNQGVRYILLSSLLEMGDDASVQSLLERYPDDAMAEWVFGRALHAFCTGGDTPHSRDLLREANESNPHVAAYLLGRKRIPSDLPQVIGFGDESEAVACAAGQLPAWKKARGALDWLRRQTTQS